MDEENKWRYRDYPPKRPTCKDACSCYVASDNYRGFGVCSDSLEIITDMDEICNWQLSLMERRR